MNIYVIKNPENKNYKQSILELYAKTIKYDKEISIYIEKFGKPYIENNPFYFNVSHSYDYYIIACSQYEMGIDIEKHREFHFDKIREYFTDNENFYIKQYGENAFFDLWCKKESFVKLYGYSIFHFIKNQKKYNGDYNKCLFSKINIDDKYSCYVASNHKEDINIINM